MKSRYTHEQLIEWSKTHTIRGGIEEVPADEKKEEKPAEKTAEEVQAEKDEKEEREEALRLYRALNGEKGVDILKVLAKEAGLLQEEGKTKEEAKDLILDALSESLGSEYKFLAPKLKPALDKILKAQEDRINKRFEDLGSKDLERETDSAISGMMKDHEDFKLHVPAIEKLMEEFPSNGKTPQRQYLEKLYKLAKLEASESKPNSRQERLRRATNDAATRLAPSGGKDKDHSKSTPKSLKESIAEALDEQMAEAEK